MAEKSIIISAEEEAILLKPIDEYVGKIQEQIDALRVEGSDKVNSLKNQIAIAKENKNLTKEEQNKIIGECKKNLEKAKATEDANKQQIAKLIADAEGFLSKHYNSEYYNIVAKSCEAEKKAEDKVFDAVEQQPSFPGGQGAMFSYISNNLRYPQKAAENAVEGRVSVKFIVEKDGSISNVEVNRSDDADLDNEAIRVIKSMPKWNPAKQDGTEVRAYYNVPVTFRLN